ncbi:MULTISPECIES: hypothetical protein [Pseudomonas]|uniref:hypothetical protein n=1 Tax=Pseudomonas TaxID=286 RepID=UPI001BECC23E|nr:MULTISPECIES: hypothetical protein [Pseudomonas]MBT2340537.1 hypothetical protein [Pseudomonas fluorescens]
MSGHQRFNANGRHFGGDAGAIEEGLVIVLVPNGILQATQTAVDAEGLEAQAGGDEDVALGLA